MSFIQQLLEMPNICEAAANVTATAYLKKGNITQSQIMLAIGLVKANPIMDKLANAGFKYENKPQAEKNGSISFRMKYMATLWNGEQRVQEQVYIIHVNGLIRVADGAHPEARTKLTSPIADLSKIANEPNKTALIYSTYITSLEELLKKASSKRGNFKTMIKT